MDNLPIPKSKTGLFGGLLLTIFSFLVYYLCLYSGLETTYYGHYWTKGPYSPSTIKADIDIYAPRFLYSFVEREFIIQASNPDPKVPISIAIVISQKQPPDDLMILICPEQSNNTKGCDKGSSTISFDQILPHSTVSQTVWVSVKPISKGAYHPPDYLYFDYYLIEKDQKTGELKEPKQLPNSDASRAAFVKFQTFVQSFISVILLPPWSNGLIPILAFLVTWYFEERFRQILPSSPVYSQKDKSTKNTIGTLLKTVWTLFSHQCVWAWLLTYFGILFVLVFLPQVILDFSDEMMPNWGEHVLGVAVGVVLLLMGIFLAVSKSACCLHEREPNDKARDETELRYLLADASIAKDILKRLQTHHTRLPEMERYFSLLADPNWFPDTVLKASVQATSPQWLRQCSNPALLRKLLDLSASSRPPKLSGGIPLLDGLVQAGTQAMDEILQEELRKRQSGLRLKILKSLANSNRPAGDVIAFFEQARPLMVKEEIKILLMALANRLTELPKYHQNISDLLKEGRRVLKGPLMRELWELDDDEHKAEKPLLEIGKYISARELIFAVDFIYEELPYLQGKLIEEFFPFLQAVMPALKRKVSARQLVGISTPRQENFKRLLEQDWFNPKKAMLGNQPDEFSQAFDNAERWKTYHPMTNESRNDVIEETLTKTSMEQKSNTEG